MYALLLTLHILVCLLLIVAVLLQSGKGGGLAGGAFGGTAQTVLGGRGATDFITRATMVLGGAFFLTSLILALMSTGTRATNRSLMQEEARRATPTQAQPRPGQAAPGQPGPGQQAPTQQAPAQPAPAEQPPAGATPATPQGTPQAPPGGNR